jgi:hypothetical protein
MMISAVPDSGSIPGTSVKKTYPQINAIPT